MRGRGRGGGWARWTLLTLAALAVACVRPEGRLLGVARAIELGSTAYRSLAVDPSGRLWLGAPGALAVHDSGGEIRRLRFDRGALPRVVGWMDGRAYVRSGTQLAVVAAGGERVDTARAAFSDNPVLLDVRGRYLYQGAATGAVLAHDPATLEPAWAWPALGMLTTALAASPEGDLLYHAVGSPGDAPRVLFRDLQTGRTLGAVSFSAPFRWLETDAEGRVYGMLVEGARGAVMAMRPVRADLEVVWRQSLRELGLPGDAEVRLAPRGRRMVLFGGKRAPGLRLLDVETGEVVGSLREAPLDAAFGPDGTLFVLYPGEVRVIR